MKKSTEEKQFILGIDVGSTTVKSVLVDAGNDEVLWQDYQRHDTRQPAGGKDRDDEEELEEGLILCRKGKACRSAEVKICCYCLP